MDHILIINRIGRTLMTITTHSSIQSFEIAPGPITTSVRKEPYKYDACPFTYSKEALGGRLEIWDCTGRLVYSWQRTYLSAGAQLRRPSVGLRTSSRTACGVSDVKTEGDSHGVQLMAVQRVQHEPSPVGPKTPPQTLLSDSNRNIGRASRKMGSNATKRKRSDTTESVKRVERNKAAPQVTRNRGANYIEDSDIEDSQSTPAESESDLKSSKSGEDSDSLHGFIVDERDATKDKSDHDLADEEFTEDSDAVVPSKRRLRIANSDSSPTTYPITKSQKKFLINLLTTIQELEDDYYFGLPVGSVEPNLEDYLEKIENPMDLDTMKSKLRDDMYPCLSSCFADMDQIVQNSVLYNGEYHEISAAAKEIRYYFRWNLRNMPRDAATQAQLEYFYLKRAEDWQKKRKDRALRRLTRAKAKS